MDEKNRIILFPEYEKLRAEVEEIRGKISVHLLERDELAFVACKNIETAYMLTLGGLEYKAFELHCKVLRLKRKIELIQAKKNRQEKIVLSMIEAILDGEFATFQQKLDAQIDKLNQAIAYSKGEPLTDEETKELKQLYHKIVKALHPDLHPYLTETQKELFHHAVQAYEMADLERLRVIGDMLAEPVIPEPNEDSLSLLRKEKERLTKSLEKIQLQIETIKSSYPYTMKDLMEDPEQIAVKKKELEELIEALKDAYARYTTRLKELMEEDV